MEVIPRIMEVLKDRLSTAYMRINETDPRNPILRKISGLCQRVNEIASTAVASR